MRTFGFVPEHSVDHRKSPKVIEIIPLPPLKAFKGYIDRKQFKLAGSYIEIFQSLFAKENKLITFALPIRKTIRRKKD
jgi:hypothetical protein